MKIINMLIVTIFLIGCGNNNTNNIIVLGDSNKPILDEVNAYRTKGVTCANEQYNPTHKLKTIDVAGLINQDEYAYGAYDSDAVFTINEDENLTKLFDERLNCDYLFGEFTHVMSYDEPTLFLGGVVDEEQ
ncbi:MAG TPA: hypothetical protein ENK66_08235 [Arcobacter sp.]|nr:hypothetical protein [Arcobacter sp.]